MKTVRSRFTLVAAGLALAVASTPAQGPTMGASVDLLSFRVTDAEYSEQLGLIVAVSGSPSNRIHVYDPVAQSGTWADLPVAGSCVSVGPDGTQAAVGHNGWISIVDLSTVTVVDTIPTGADVSDIVLAGNGFAYAFPRTGQWVNIHCIEIATRAETLSTGGSIRERTQAKLHPNGTKVYGADNGLSPSDIEKYDIAPGTAQYLYDSPYHGTHSMAGDLWISEDGLRIFVRGGNVFRSSDVRAEDMLFNGSLTNLTLVTWLDHSAEAGKFVAIPEPGFTGGAPDTELQLYDYQFLGFEGSYPFPNVTVGPGSYPTHGRFVFFEGDGSHAWAIVEVDATSGLLFDHGIVQFELSQDTPALTTDVGAISISGGGIQTMSLDAGTAHAGMTYLVVGSIQGTQPGIPLGQGVLLPLNFDFVYFTHTVNRPNEWPHYNTLGMLDAQGLATSTFDLSSRTFVPGVAGTVVHHAFVVIDGTGMPVFASNPARLILDP